jgi:hypothetical protein
VLYSHHRTVRVVLTRYQTNAIIPKFFLSLSSLQNLHTLQVLHAQTQMTTTIKYGVQGLVFPRMRTLIIPGHCHEILKCCPHVTKVWCNHSDGSKLVTAISKYCKEVQEMRGFSAGERLVKSVLNNCKELKIALLPNTVLQELLRQLLICVFWR